MFVKVNHADLVIGEKYMITSNSEWYYTGKFHSQSMESQLFGKVVFHPNGTKRMDTPAHLIPEYRIFQCQVYYQFVYKKEKIQQAMEQRALDKILKRLVNDDFT